MRISGRVASSSLKTLSVHQALVNGARFLTAAALLLLLLFKPTGAVAQMSVVVSGTVVDQTGSAVAGARITLRAGKYTRDTTTDNQGRFSFENVPASSGTVEVNASGFANAAGPWNSGGKASADIGTITLAPQAPSQQVTVTAARTEARVSDTAQSIQVLTSQDLDTTGALTLDDALKQVQGFTLFRRSSSRTSNPTSQGVSLRGIGASGASRALVLADGIPLDDPFGGWVYWDRIPREEIGRVEVLQGGASSLYGTDALSGVINVIRQDPHDSVFSLETSYGNENSPEGSMFASGRLGNWIGSIAGEAFNTDGYVIVDKSQAGRIDTPAGEDHSGLEITLERVFSDHGRAFLRGSIFGEARENGTPVQTNRTHTRELDAGLDWGSTLAGDFALRVYGSLEIFDQNFSSVAADRNSEFITNRQRVPSQQLGFSGQWSRNVGNRQTLLAGAEFREIHGYSNELTFLQGALNNGVGAGGRERTAGVFGQDIIRLSESWLLTVGARYDHWSNYDALSVTRPLTHPGPTTIINYPDRDENALSPRVSLLHRLNDHVSLSASVYRAFRAPTLNELYRNFRVGNVVTTANADLMAERLTGYEGGASVTAWKQRLNVRGTFFWADVSRAIANVTLSTTPTLITRQRENLGSTRSRGVEIDASARLTNTIFVSGGYEFVDASVTRFDQNPLIVNSLIPHVPRNTFTVQGRYSNPRIITIGVQGRFVGNQYDDDFNTLLLGRFFTMDALASRALNPHVEIFAAVENIFDTRYTVSLTPVRTIGPPTLARAGLRLHFGAR